MSSIFDKYKASKTASIKKLSEEEDEKTLTKRTDRIDLPDGVEIKLRLGPAHPGEDSFLHQCGSHWIKVDKDGKAGTRKVPNARVHADLSKDPIEAYIEYVRTNLSDGSSESAEKIKNLTSFKGGMALSVTWLTYAKRIVSKTERGPWNIWEFWRPVRDDLKNKMVIEDESEAIELDPFTDPLTGKCVRVKWEKAKKKTIINISEHPTKLTEEELVEYDKLTPISRLPEMQYTMTDFDLAMEGIQYWDEANEIELFNNEDLQEIFTGLRNELKEKLGGKATSKEEDPDEDLPFEEDEDPKPAKSSKKTAKPEPKKPAAKKVEEEPDEEEAEAEEETTEEDEEGSEADEFEGMTRQELIAYKSANLLDIKIFKSDTDDQIREKIREAVGSGDAEAETEVEEEVEEVEEEKPAKPTPKKADAKAGSDKKPALSLEDIKKQLANKSKK